MEQIRTLQKFVPSALGLLIFCLFQSKYCSDAAFTTQIGPKSIWNSTFTDKLRLDLLQNYDKFARPAQHYNLTTIKFGLVLRHLDVDEFKSTLAVYSWTKMVWNDDKLKWNKSEYGGLTSVKVAEHEIWLPDIFLYNSPSSAVVAQYSNVPIVVGNDGTIIWVPPTTYYASCDIDLTYWPYDTQTCDMKFGSWTYHGDEVNITLYSGKNETVTTGQLTVHGTEWNLVSVNAQRNSIIYPCCPEPYPDVTITLVLQRQSASYNAIIITPLIVIIALTLTAFWLPPQSGEKLILHCSIIIIVCIFLLYFAQKLPAMSTHAPLIVLFYSKCLCISVFATVSTVVVLWISRVHHSQPLPWVVKKYLTGTFGKLLLLWSFDTQSLTNIQRVTAEEMRDHQVASFEEHSCNEDHQIIKSNRKTSPQEDWILLGIAIDRIIFLIYSFTFIILSIVYSV